MRHICGLQHRKVLRLVEMKKSLEEVLRRMTAILRHSQEKGTSYVGSPPLIAAKMMFV